MDFLNNVRIKLQAKDFAAVIIVLILCITVLGLFGDGLSKSALTLLGVALGYAAGIIPRLIANKK